ncbi:hypothetical protein D3C86_2123360 [compost metagenome]
MAAQAEQAQAVATYFARAGCQGFGRQQHLGAAHPVAHQAVHVFRHGLALLCQQRAGAGQGGDGHVGEGLVAQHMVRMVVGQE